MREQLEAADMHPGQHGNRHARVDRGNMTASAKFS